eukprot:2161366-Ditylum_brightwellii.AAC.1
MQNAPDKVAAVPRLLQDLEALKALPDSETPPSCLLRGHTGTSGTSYRIGVWILESKGTVGWLSGAKVFLFGDNQIGEAIYYK